MFVIVRVWCIGNIAYHFTPLPAVYYTIPSSYPSKIDHVMSFMSFILPILPPALMLAVLCWFCHIPIIVASTQHIYLSHPTPSSNLLPHPHLFTYPRALLHVSFPFSLFLFHSPECRDSHIVFELCRKNPLPQTAAYASMLCAMCLHGLCLLPGFIYKKEGICHIYEVWERL